jgi:hypothetical protein
LWCMDGEATTPFLVPAPSTEDLLHLEVEKALERLLSLPDLQAASKRDNHGGRIKAPVETVLRLLRAAAPLGSRSRCATEGGGRGGWEVR